MGLRFWQLGSFYSGAASATAAARGGSGLVSMGTAGLLSVSMGSSGFSSAAASIASSEASTTASAGAFSSAGTEEELVTGAISAAVTASISATTLSSVEATGSSLVFPSAASTGASASMLATSFTCSAFFSSSARVSCSLLCFASNWDTGFLEVLAELVLLGVLGHLGTHGDVRVMISCRSESS